MTDEKLNRLEKQQRDPDAIHSQYAHQIHFESGFVMDGYSEMNWVDKDGNKKPWPFAGLPGRNFNNYFLRIVLGPKSPYYPGHKRGVSKIVFFENTNAGDMVAKLLPKGVIQWSKKYIEDKEWDRVRERLEFLVTKYIGLLPENPNPVDLKKCIDMYRYSKKGLTVDFDSKDLSKRFQSQQSLHNYCKLLKDAGYPAGEVDHYYYQYMEKYFNQTV